jgi:hypothetical protein
MIQSCDGCHEQSDDLLCPTCQSSRATKAEAELQRLREENARLTKDLESTRWVAAEEMVKLRAEVARLTKERDEAVARAADRADTLAEAERAYESSLDGHQARIRELEAERDEWKARLGMVPSEAAKPVAWRWRYENPTTPWKLVEREFQWPSVAVGQPLYEHPAPSPSARVEEPARWSLQVSKEHQGVLFRNGDWVAKNVVVTYDPGTPPDLTAEIAKLRHELAAGEGYLKAANEDRNEWERMHKERDAEIAKLKADLEEARTNLHGHIEFRNALLSERRDLGAEIRLAKKALRQAGQARERVTTGWLVRYERDMGIVRKTKAEARESARSLNAVGWSGISIARLTKPVQDRERAYWVVKLKENGTYRRNGEWKGRDKAIRFPSLADAREDMRACIKGGFTR